MLKSIKSVLDMSAWRLFIISQGRGDRLLLLPCVRLGHKLWHYVLPLVSILHRPSAQLTSLEARGTHTVPGPSFQSNLLLQN